MEKISRIPEPTIERLPLYHRCLAELAESGREVVSSEDVAHRIPGVKASQFRKDLSCFGEFGVQGMGYVVAHLLDRITAILQLDRVHPVVLVGVGNLGRALVNYPGFRQWSFRICRIFDADPEKVGTHIHGLEVEDVSILPTPLDASLGIITVPPSASPHVAGLLVASGLRGLMDFSGAKLDTPPGVAVRSVDLTHALSILAFKLSQEGAVFSRR